MTKSKKYLKRKKREEFASTDTTSAIDKFVELVNKNKLGEPPLDYIPEYLIEEEDESGFCYWKIKPIDEAPWIDDTIKKLPGRLPPSFLSLYTRYMFLGFDMDPVFFFANTGGDNFYEWSDYIFSDKYMSPFLLERGFIQIAKGDDINYDPICFNINQMSKKNPEPPIVQIDHEEILCNSTLKIVKEIAPSFLDLIKRFIKEMEEEL